MNEQEKICEFGHRYNDYLEVFQTTSFWKVTHLQTWTDNCTLINVDTYVLIIGLGSLISAGIFWQLVSK